MRPMVLLFLALFNSVLGFSILFPIFAPLGRELGLTEPEVGYLSVGYAAMQLLLAPSWGRLSERVGRRPVLLLGVGGFGIGFLLFGVAAEAGMRHLLQAPWIFWALFGSRVVAGAFSSATIPTAQAYAADISAREDRTSAMAVIGAAFGLGIVVGPGLGAAISQLTGSLLAPVYFSSLVAAFNATFIWLRLPEPERPPAPPPSEQPASSLATRLWPLLAVALAMTVASVSMDQTIAFYIQDRLSLSNDATPMYVGSALMVYGVVAVITQGWLVRRARLAPRTLLLLGLPLAMSGYVGLVFARSFVALVAALSVQALGQGLAIPGVTAAVSLSAGDREQGPAAGLSSSAQGLGRTLGPFVGTHLYRRLHELPYGFSAALLLLVLATLAFLPGIGAASAPDRDEVEE